MVVGWQPRLSAVATCNFVEFMWNCYVEFVLHLIGLILFYSVLFTLHLNICILVCVAVTTLWPKKNFPAWTIKCI